MCPAPPKLSSPTSVAAAAVVAAGRKEPSFLAQGGTPGALAKPAAACAKPVGKAKPDGAACVKALAEYTDVLISNSTDPRHMCAACGTPDATHKCARCKLAYCGAACQRLHWKTGGHKKRCERIARDGLEQYYADARARAAADRAVASCRSSKEGGRCRLCGGDGAVVRACSCEGGDGWFHLDCLARAATDAAARDGARSDRLKAWHACPDCGHEFSGVVQLAVARCCWSRYVRYDPTDVRRVFAMNNVGNALHANGLHREELFWREAELLIAQQYFPSNESTSLAVQDYLASCYRSLGRIADALEVRRRIYSRRRDACGPLHKLTVVAGKCLAGSLADAGLLAEQRHVLRKTWPRAARVLGPTHYHTLNVGLALARALLAPDASATDVVEAEALLAEIYGCARQELGGASKTVRDLELKLREAREREID